MSPRTPPDVAAVQRELRKVDRRYRDAAERAEERRSERLAAIRAAQAAGMTNAEIARAIGIGRDRVGKMLGPRQGRQID